MFEYIKGILAEASPLKAVVEVHGLGYGIFIPANNYAKLPPLGKEVLLHTSLIVREDAHRLYGFLSRGEKELFNQLTELSGIGPKTALALVGHLEVEDFQAAIAESNLSLICKVPGVGKKTAERLIIDMRDKIKNLDTTSFSQTGEKGPTSDAISALVHLGYHPLAAQKAVKAVLKDTEEAPELAKLITAALKRI